MTWISSLPTLSNDILTSPHSIGSLALTIGLIYYLAVYSIFYKCLKVDR